MIYKPEVCMARPQPPNPAVSCTRNEGHSDDHVARGSRAILCIWSDEEPSVNKIELYFKYEHGEETVIGE